MKPRSSSYNYPSTGSKTRAAGLRRTVVGLFCLICLILAAFGIPSLPSAWAQASGPNQPIGIDERIGEIIPPDIRLFDEQGQAEALGAIIQKPTILVLIYYTCDRLCPQMLAGLATALPQLGLTPDKDYQVVTVSFDERDTPALARHLKRNYLKAVNRPFPKEAWRFLIGDYKNIQALCSAAGFTFRKEHEGFSHPMTLIILTPGRRITQYIHVSKFSYGVEYPITFSPIGLSQALADASQGKAGALTKKEFLYCFPHEPYRQQGFYHILMLIGGGTIIGLVLFFVYLVATGRKPRKEKSP